jgi:hypothetical protein
MRFFYLFAFTSFTTLAISAGDWGKAPVDKAPIEECVDLGGEISLGYETDYLFKGVAFAGDSVWTDVSHTITGLPVPVTVGAWYLNGINESALGAAFDELDLYLSAELGTFAGFDVDFGYTHYTFPEFRGNSAPLGGYGEANVGISRRLGVVDLKYSLDYGFGGGISSPNGWFHQLGAEKAFSVSDSVALVLGAGLAYSDGYWGGSGWNHYYATVSLPVTLNCRTTLTPYVGYVGGPDTWIVDGIFGGIEPQTDVLHGGVALSVSF